MNDDADIGTLPAWPELPEGRPRTTLDLAAAKLRAALQDGAGYVLVTAENARVSEALFLRIEPDLQAYRTLRVSGRTLDPEGVVAALWKKVEPATSPPRAAVRLMIDRARAAGHPIVVAIADADEADPVVLETLRVMLEGAPDAGEIVRIALLGGTGLVELLRTPDARAIAVRIGASIAVPTATSALVNAAVHVDPPRRRRVSVGVVAIGTLVGVVALVLVAGAIAWMSTRAAVERAPVQAAQAPVVVPPAPPSPEPAPAPAPAVPEPSAPVVAEAAPAVAPPAPSANAAPAPEPEPPATAPAAEALAPAAPVVAPPADAIPSVEVEAGNAAPAPDPAPVAKLATPEPEAPAGLLADALQVGAFAGKERAETLRRQLAGRFPSVTVKSIAREGRTLYRVRVGGFRTEQDLGLAAAALRSDGYQPMRVRD